MRLSQLVLFAGAGLLFAPSGADGAQNAGDSILDLNSYWRSFYILRPARTSPRQWKTIKLPGGRKYSRWGTAGRDVAKLPSWRHAFVWGSFSHHGHSSPLTTIARTPQPPTGWEKPDFNASAWPRNRFPLLMQAGHRDQEERWDGYLAHMGGACFRATFTVPDPGKVKQLTLRVVYRGGMVASINGHELARGHLPAGKIGPDTVPTDYPEDAYVLPPNEKRAEKYRKNKYSVGEIGGKHASRGYDAWNGVWRDNWMTAEEHELIIKKRNRVLGPVVIPGKLLRKGTNVLALRMVRSDYNPVVNFGKSRLGPNTHYGWIGYMTGTSWWHGAVLDVSLRPDPATSVPRPSRPSGLQVWVEDVHQRLSNKAVGDARAPVLRMLGARCGSYSAQLVVGTSRALGKVSVKTGALTGPGGAQIPVEAIRVRYVLGRSVRDLAGVGVMRSPRFARVDVMRCSDAWMAVWRDGVRGKDGKLLPRRYIPSRGPDGKRRPEADRKRDHQLRDAAMNSVKFFDELGVEPPAGVAADSCQPVWITVKIPEKAPAGLYSGKVRVTAGSSSVEVPLRLQVFDWKLPDPAKKQKLGTFLALEQSPWGVAKAHKVKPWSKEHFARLEDSLRFMGQMGNDYLIIPVLLDSEFGNREDSFVTWVKGRDGKLSCDFSRFERYLDIARKYTPKPRAVVFAVVHPAENSLWVVPRVLLRDEATGKTAPYVVPFGDINLLKTRDRQLAAAEKAKLKAFWKPFTNGALALMKKRGLEKSIYLGYEWDYGTSVEWNKGVFAELAPGVSWARGAHNPGVRGTKIGTELYGAQGLIISFKNPVKREGSKHVIHSYKGWKSPKLWFSIPRAMSGVLNVEGRAAPFAWRAYPELAIASGAVGIGRVGLDYWNWTYQDGWRGGGQVGMSINTCAWPGKGRIHSSARLEMLREGLQEAEARIVIEKALEGAFANGAAGKQAQKTLDERIMATLHMPRMVYCSRAYEYHGGWQERSWKLYAAAAGALGARAPGAAAEKKFFSGE